MGSQTNYSHQLTMKGSLCLVGLTLLIALTEARTFRHPARKELRSSRIPSLGHKIDTDYCTEECGFELELTLELCKLNESAIADEGSYRNCVEDHFAPDFETDCYQCLCTILRNQGTPCGSDTTTPSPDNPTIPTSRSETHKEKKNKPLSSLENMKSKPLIQRLAKHKPSTEDCEEDCGFALQLALELCSLSPADDEDTFRGCLESKFPVGDDCNDCLCDTLANQGAHCHFEE